jgi:predicted hydrocarbon binding protein
MKSKENELQPAILKNLATAVDYFAPAITKIQEHTGVETALVMKNIGRFFGQKVAEAHEASSLSEFMSELAKLWEDSKVGRIRVESIEPLVFRTDECAVCGQLPAGEVTFTCAFHEGFFEAAFSSKLGRPVHVTQESSFQGGAGTFGRRYMVHQAG